MESFKIASRNKETLNFFVLQVVSLTNEQQSQNFFLKVDPLSTIQHKQIDHTR